MSGLTLIEIHKSFGDTRALAGVSFEVEQGETIAVLGPSGCGKSTLLAIVAGLELADRGELFWEGKSLANQPPHLRNFGLMFQDFALFPHRNVIGNVAFGLQMLGVSHAQIRSRVAEELELVGLPGFESRDVNTLSGGEGQRVALARSLAPHPRLLMLDEPLGSLDRNLRERLALDLRQILSESHQTAIYVTHDQEEAFAIAGRVVVMNAGKVEQIDSPQEIFNQPVSTFVARFLGLSNLFEGHIRLAEHGSEVVTPIGVFPVSHHPPGPVKVLLRPDSLSLGSHGICHISGEMELISFRGNTCKAIIGVNGVSLTVDFPSSTPLSAKGEAVHLSFDPQVALQFFDETEYPTQ